MNSTTTFFAAIVSLFLAFAPLRAAAQGRGADRPPQREVRAVWLTTAAGLDWPASRDTAEQKSSLLAAVERLHRSGFNTIFFQVRGRGDACYRSRLEPWSEVLTGKQGRDPGWDPLAFILAEAHARGMEVHAWFNACFVRGGAAPPERTTPPHVMTAHPGWAKFSEDRWWLDPGEPGVEDYLAAIARDIAVRYDLDGFHLDYLRYPGRNFDDAATYARHGRGAPKDAWRRANVTRLLTRLRETLLEARPGMKLGVAPIGIYRNPRGVRGLESYTDVYQDTYRWIELGLVDYVAPQLYWPLGGGNGDPDFAAMAAEWRKQTPRGCHLYLGIGSYKDAVLAQTDRLVAAARGAGAEGEAFFRYASIAPVLPLAPYGAPALPPVMVWKDSVPPPPPAFAADSGDGRSRTIRWDPPAGRIGPGGRYAVYRMSAGSDGQTLSERLAAVLPATTTAWIDTQGAADPRTWYAVTSVDRAWNESAPVRAARPGVPLAAAPALPEAGAPAPTKALPSGILRVGTPWADVASGMLFVPLRLEEGAKVVVDLRGPGGEPARRSRPAAAKPGGQVVGIDIRGIGEGGYVCSVSAGGDVVERPVKIGR